MYTFLDLYCSLANSKLDKLIRLVAATFVFNQRGKQKDILNSALGKMQTL